MPYQTIEAEEHYAEALHGPLSSSGSGLSRRLFLRNSALTAAVLGFSGFSLQAEETGSPLLLKTPSGVLRGMNTGKAKVFRGVPFAIAPTGTGRFRAPQKIKPWVVARDATKLMAAPFQNGNKSLSQSEDCLALNIWAPLGKGPFPVYVWIHGGGFTGGYSGESTYDGTDFAQAGVISISISYRLGVLGFLDVEPLLGQEYAGSANNALRDLILGLEWIQENIAAFGGDPHRVTIGGESAGAKLTGILLGTPSARPLFQQMISQSGGAERVWDKKNATAIAEGFGAFWKKQTGQDPKTIATAPARQLMEVQQQFTAQWPQHFPLRAEIDGALVPVHPLKTIASGSSKGKRFLIGSNRDESALFIGPHPQRAINAGDLGNLDLQKFNTVYAAYKKLFPEMPEDELRIRALTAEEYWIPTIRTVDAHVKGGGSAWVYRLDFTEQSGRLKGYAFHALDIRLTWNRPHREIENSSVEVDLSKQIQHAWVEFIHGKTPSDPALPAWPQYRESTRPTMILDIKSHIEKNPQIKELELWKGILS